MSNPWFHHMRRSSALMYNKRQFRSLLSEFQHLPNCSGFLNSKLLKTTRQNKSKWLTRFFCWNYSCQPVTWYSLIPAGYLWYHYIKIWFPSSMHLHQQRCWPTAKENKILVKVKHQKMFVIQTAMDLHNAYTYNIDMLFV